ncbi:MAG TPA: hypothetical protein DCM86_08630 [Verrucomicrobiales bacterium]|nr:hypothetical protein [Verrucomicrobiales bacterium]
MPSIQSDIGFRRRRRALARCTFCAGGLALVLCLLRAAGLQGGEPAPWWSLARLEAPALPAVPARLAAGVRNPVDLFIRARLAAEGIEPSPEAGRETLVRRLFLDLTGLPPTPAEIDRFVADTKPDAYERLVDRLLDSPRYGERWARHWLDVVHYGDTHGYDKDKPRPNAWPYRDYVIRAFNEDRPYGRFIQEQVAGDVLFPGTRDGIEALGFISAGPWDFIGHEEVPESKIDGRVARHLDRDDMVVNTVQTFNSLTVQCAQCHNHKFDPITQEEYYSLQAVFAAVDRTNRRYDIDPGVARSRAALEGRIQSLAARRKELEGVIEGRAGPGLGELNSRISALEKSSAGSAAVGYHSAIEKGPEVAKWVQVDLGGVMPLGGVVLHPCHDDFNGIGDGFGFPVRYRVEVSADPEFKSGTLVLADFTGADVPNPGVRPQGIEGEGKSGRYVRVTATRLAPRQNDFIFALAELEVRVGAGRTNAALGRPVAALDSIEAPVRWQRSNLTDGWYPGAPAGSGLELAGVRAERTALLARHTRPGERVELESIDGQLAEARQGVGRLPAQSVAYVGSVHTGSGAFTGTGASGGKPREIRVLNRGNLLKPGGVVGPGTLSAVQGLPSRLEVAPSDPEGARRAALAKWLSDPRNSLTWRSIANRLWQQHFGRGIVETPNDFGRMGAKPSHPELLDWLAVQLRDGGESIKKLQRIIVTSATYRQVSDPSTHPSHGAGRLATEASRGGGIDSDNRLLWRMNRRKLDAETVRDSLLSVAGDLDLTMGGPAFQDFVVDKPEHSPHYEYHLHDPADPKSHRRSIYRFIVRSQPQPFMAALDCADPSMQVGRRNESVSPLQALAMLNDALVLRMSSRFAEKLERSGGSLASKVERACREALGHPLPPGDRKALAAYAREHGLENACRVLFNLNEFSFVD